MNTTIVKLMSQVSTLSEELNTSPDSLISLIKERIDYGRCLESILLGKPVLVRDPEDDHRITKSDISWCMDRLKFLLQPENRNEYVRILNRRD
jgi:hypothetical protein